MIDLLSWVHLEVTLYQDGYTINLTTRHQQSDNKKKIIAH